MNSEKRKQIPLAERWSNDESPIHTIKEAPPENHNEPIEEIKTIEDMLEFLGADYDYESAKFFLKDYKT